VPERTLVISSASQDWKALTDVTFPAMAAWAARHGYKFFPWVCETKDYYYDPHTKNRELVPVRGFVKMDLFLRFLPEYDRVIWLDADMIITDYEPSIDDLTWSAPHELILPYEHNGINATVIIARSTERVYDFMWAVNNTGRKLFLYHDWKEMEAMRYFLMTPPYEDMVTYISAKRLCPILHTEYIDAGVPAKVSEKYGWSEGDFALHLSALSVERRTELAREYAARYPAP
jgi:hypothetical protein